MTKSENLTVNIVTPMYNAASTVMRTYQSLRNQKYSNWRWIVVDDYSTDLSFELVSKISGEDSRVIVVKNAGASGAGLARNVALSYVNTGIVSFIDADDEWHNNFLSEMLPYVAQPNSMAFSGYVRRYSNFETSFIPSKCVKFEDLFRGSDISCLSAIYHFAMCNEIPKFGEIKARNDLVFNLRALQIIECAQHVPLALGTYHIQAGSISRNKLKLIYYQYKVSRMFGRSIGKSLIDVVFWAVYGIKKYA